MSTALGAFGAASIGVLISLVALRISLRRARVDREVLPELGPTTSFGEIAADLADQTDDPTLSTLAALRPRGLGRLFTREQLLTANQILRAQRESDRLMERALIASAILEERVNGLYRILDHGSEGRSRVSGWAIFWGTLSGAAAVITIIAGTIAVMQQFS